MEPKPSWEAASSSATQELPSIFWNQKAHYCVPHSPPVVPTLHQIDSVHTNPSYLRPNTTDDKPHNCRKSLLVQ
jgi:hypothetical protein